MGLTRNAFNVLAALVRDDVRTQRDIADASGLSLGVVNREYRELADKGLVDEAQVTPGLLYTSLAHKPLFISIYGVLHQNIYAKQYFT